MCRANWAKIAVTIWSVATALGGLIVITFSFLLILGYDHTIGASNVAVEEKPTTNLVPLGISPLADNKRVDEGLNQITKRIAIIAFVVGATAVIFGLSGICTVKVQRCPCTFVFGFVSLILTAAYGLAAYVLLQLYFVTEQQITDFCNADLKLDQLDVIGKKMVKEVQNYVYTVDKQLKAAVDKHMCTDFCPCQSDAKGSWDYSIYGTSTALLFKDEKSNDYNFGGTQTVFTNCYAERKTLWPQQNPNHVEVDAEVISLMQTLEQEFDCSGLCSHATFWASKDIKNGPPQQSCIVSLKDAFDENMVMLGWSVACTAFCALWVFLLHFWLYCRGTAVKTTSIKRRFIFD